MPSPPDVLSTGSVSEKRVWELIADYVGGSGGGGGSSLFSAYAYLRDQKAAGTVGGDSVTNTWNTRALTTEVFDAGNIVTLSANRFTLLAGSYFIEAHAPAVFCDHQKLRLRDITNSADLAVGTSQYSTANSGVANLRARITLSGSTVIELQHWVSNGLSTTGLGTPTDQGSGPGVLEVYAEVMIYKET